MYAAPVLRPSVERAVESAGADMLIHEMRWGDQPSSQSASKPTSAPAKIMTIRRIHSSPFRPDQNFDGISTAQHTARVMKNSVPMVFQLSVKRRAARSVVVMAAKTADIANEPDSSATLSRRVNAGSATGIVSPVTGETTGTAGRGLTGISFAFPTGLSSGRGAGTTVGVGVLTGVATGTSPNIASTSLASSAAVW